MKFYDTCALLELQQDVLKSKFIISSITLSELESIKTSANKDEETKWAARRLLHLLEENEGVYFVVPYNSNTDDEILKTHGLIINNDNRIIASALNYNKIDTDLIFVTSDLSCKAIAKTLGLNTEFAFANYADDDYLGYYEIQMNNLELANFYEKVYSDNHNVWKLKDNEYLIIKDNTNSIIDKYRWYNNKYISVPFHKAESKMFGKIVPKDNDIYQQLALDSLINNQITMLRGPAGSGKSYLAFGYMFDLLEKGKIDKIIIFCNTVATKGSAKLGFYPGSRTEKLLDSQIGNLLESKIGDRMIVEKLINDGQLVLLPMSDIRGYDTTGMNAVIYISEAQNLDIELMRLALQRIGEDSICIIDGDDRTQVDMSLYAGSHNGMKRVSEIFRGADFYGEITLRNIYRSKIAALAQKL